jgi:hypothetical protein
MRVSPGDAAGTGPVAAAVAAAAAPAAAATRQNPPFEGHPASRMRSTAELLRSRSCAERRGSRQDGREAMAKGREAAAAAAGVAVCMAETSVGQHAQCRNNRNVAPAEPAGAVRQRSQRRRQARAAHCGCR